MDRREQVSSHLVKEYFENYGFMPSVEELDKLIRQQGVYAPFTNPIVPLNGALSNSDYITTSLISILNDRTDINRLLEDLSYKVDRVQTATFLEVNKVTNKAIDFLNNYYGNTFKTVYNERPELYTGADVSEFYLHSSELYIEEDTDPGWNYIPQYIDLDSFNVRSGDEGLQLIRTNQKLLTAALDISSFYDKKFGNPVSLTTINDLNPLSVIVSGVAGDEKGISIKMDILDVELATITIDVDPIYITVLLDGYRVLTKSLDGKTTLAIHKKVSDSIEIRLTDTAAQVHVNMRDLQILETNKSPVGQFTDGMYVTVALPIDKTYGKLLFNPDEYIPTGTSIDWEYSMDRVFWEAIPIDEDTNNYLPIAWNAKEGSSIAAGAPSDILGSSLSKLVTVPTHAKGVKVKEGKGAILFKNAVRYTTYSEGHAHLVYINSEGNGETSFEADHQHDITNWVIAPGEDKHTHDIQNSMYGTSAFSFFLETIESTGYNLNMNNPVTLSGDLVFSKASIQSKDINYSEDSPSTIEVELPFGIHQVELEINSSIDLSRFNFEDKSVIDVFKENLLVNLDLNFGPDIQGREAITWIQPFSLTETDITLLDNLPEKEQTGKFGINHSDSVCIRKLAPSVYYDVILSTAVNDSIYQSLEQHIATSEIHKYLGDGAVDWTVSMYHTPVGVDEDPAQVVWNQWPGDGSSVDPPDDSPYTPAGDQITILAANLPDTTATTGYTISHGSDMSEVIFLLDEYVVPGNPVDFFRDNILSESNFQAGDLWYRPSGIILPGSKTIEIDSRDFHTESVINDQITLTEDNKIPLAEINAYSGWVGGVYYTPQIQLKVVTAKIGSVAIALEPIVVGGNTVDAGEFAITVAGTPGSSDWHILIEGSTYLLANSVVEFMTDYEWYSFEDRSSYTFQEWPIEETIAVTDVSSESAYPFTYNEQTKVITIAGLPEIGNIYNFEIGYDYAGIQDADGAYRPDYFLPGTATTSSSYNNENQTSTHFQIIEATDNSIIYLDRIPNAISVSNGISVINTSTFNYETETPTDAVDLFDIQTNTTLSMDYIDLESPTDGSFSYSSGDILKVNYLIDVEVDTEHGAELGSNITVSNLPDPQFSWRRYTGLGTTAAPTPALEIVTSHPVAPDATIAAGIGGGAINVSAKASWVDANNVPQTYEEDNITVASASGNTIIADLSGFSALNVPQPVVEITVIYPSYEHSDLYSLRIWYDYYKAIDYSFKYSFETATSADIADVYSTPDMLSYFYDISYYTTTNEDLYLKAILHGEGNESPIIRRIRFERS